MRGRGRASQVQATAREKTLWGRSSEVSREVTGQVMGGPCEDFDFFAEENGEPLGGAEQRHSVL